MTKYPHHLKPTTGYPQSFHLTPEVIQVCGPNTCGMTLLHPRVYRHSSGQIRPDQHSISHDCIGYLKQTLGPEVVVLGHVR